MSEDPYEHYKTLIPSDNCIPLFGMRIVAYYNDQGVLSFNLTMDHEIPPPVSTAVGILELAKAQMVLVNTLASVKKHKEQREDD